jgi:hypothetical protein
MRKIILTAIVTSLVAASTVQMAAAAERHAHQTYRDGFRGAYNQLNVPSQRNVEDFGFGGWNAWGPNSVKLEPAGN